MRFEFAAATRIVFGAGTLREIAPGEEITTNYNGDPESRKAVWFEARD